MNCQKSKSMQKFSIIIPVYNVGEYISQCLDSICAQTYLDFEAIVVDDGSPDNASAICDEYAKKDPRIIVLHKENGGVSTALNLGLEHAKGEWIYFVDGDDWIEKNTLEIIDAYLKNYSDVDVVGFDNYYNDSQSERKNKPIYPTNKILDLTEIRRLAASTLFPKWIEKKYGYSLPVIRGRWSKVFRRELIFNNGIRFKNELTTGQDAFFILECLLKASRFVFIDEYLYHYRNTENSAMHKYREQWSHVVARQKLTKKLIDLEEVDFSVTWGLLAWEGLVPFFKNFLFHDRCKLSLRQKKKTLRSLLDGLNSQEIQISSEMLFYLPMYFPIALMMKFKCVNILLFFARMVYGVK